MFIAFLKAFLFRLPGLRHPKENSLKNSKKHHHAEKTFLGGICKTKKNHWRDINLNILIFFDL